MDTGRGSVRAPGGGCLICGGRGEGAKGEGAKCTRGWGWGVRAWVARRDAAELGQPVGFEIRARACGRGT